jgi:lipoyl-dependent peroxiredoxin
MATDRRAEVNWQGSLMEGSGTIRSTTSGALGEQQISWPNRAEDNPDKTSPEELIAAAHAACFSMALSSALAKAGSPPDSVQTEATVTLRTVDGTPTITKIALVTVGRVPGIDEAAFIELAQGAKAGCPVSRALAGVPEITLEASLAK